MKEYTKNLVSERNSLVKELHYMVDKIVAELICTNTAADYLYSKHIDEVYFLLGCNIIDEERFGELIDEIQGFIKTRGAVKNESK